MKWLRAVALSVIAVTVGGCYAYVPPPPRYGYGYARPAGCVWVPAHHRPFYGWVPGHWKC